MPFLVLRNIDALQYRHISQYENTFSEPLLSRLQQRCLLLAGQLRHDADGPLCKADVTGFLRWRPLP
jgi:hypothetical protein